MPHHECVPTTPQPSNFGEHLFHSLQRASDKEEVGPPRGGPHPPVVRSLPRWAPAVRGNSRSWAGEVAGVKGPGPLREATPPDQDARRSCLEGLCLLGRSSGPSRTHSAATTPIKAALRNSGLSGLRVGRGIRYPSGSMSRVCRGFPPPCRVSLSSPNR